MYWILIIAVMLASYAVQARFKNRFAKYAQVPTSSGLSGKEVAERMLRDNGIYDVKVLSSEGMLTDHYNPANKTVNLSQDVYEGKNVAAAAVAAHECGHAVQHAKAYAWLGMRSALVPVVSVASPLVSWILIIGIFVLNTFPYLLLAGIVLFAIVTLFSFITLPVEYDASNRALAWLETSHIATGDEQGMAKDALKWAALTYVIAALASLATLLYYIMIFMGASRRN
jgi:Zn-dependent membrane protease YugP